MGSPLLLLKQPGSNLVMEGKTYKKLVVLFIFITLSLCLISKFFDIIRFVSPETVENQQSADFRKWWLTKVKVNDQIKSTCDKYGAALNFTVSKGRFRYDKKHDLLFCANLKVGSSTMTAHLYNLTPVAHKVTKQKRPAVIKYFSVKEADPDVRILAESAVSFSFVRHPFERFVSAFQNKFIEREKSEIRT